MKPVSSRGSWSGFKGWKLTKLDPNNQLVCVLTRATIKVRFIYPFFNMISKVLKDHNNFPGLLFSKGFSEIPFREQATFSVWENIDQMKQFAYSSFHAMAIKITRKKKGFKEDMYTRFQPVATIGSWNGKNPLDDKVRKLNAIHIDENHYNSGMALVG